MTQPNSGVPSYQDFQRELDSAYGVLGTHDYFQRIKTGTLLKIIREIGGGQRRLRILDLGAGVGTMLKDLPEEHLRVGLEPDLDMIGQIHQSAAFLSMVHASGLQLPFQDESFDIVYMASVLHHTAPDKSARLLTECSRVLSPKGVLVVFEHNAYNLLVCLFLKLFVKIDRNAHFLKPGAVKRMIISAKLIPSKVTYLCFFPGFLGFLLRLEKYLSWLPIGGQYCLVSRKTRG